MTPISDEPRDARELLITVAAMRGRSCSACEAELCGHALLFDIVTGFQNDPRCPECLARALDRPAGFVVARVRSYIDHRDCTRAAWAEISRAEPDCRLVRSAPAPQPPDAAEHPIGDAGPVAHTYDAGDLGCGELVLELRGRLEELPPRAVLRLVARDPGAREDIPAWCSLTGHQLLTAQHPHYDIRRKDD